MRYTSFALFCILSSCQECEVCYRIFDRFRVDIYIVYNFLLIFILNTVASVGEFQKLVFDRKQQDKSQKNVLVQCCSLVIAYFKQKLNRYIADVKDRSEAFGIGIMPFYFCFSFFAKGELYQWAATEKVRYFGRIS